VAIVRVPSSASSFDIEWCVEVGAEVAAGQVMAWLCAPGRCGLEALTAPVAGRVVARWTHLVKTVLAGDAIAVVGDGDDAAVRAEELRRLRAQAATTREELEALARTSGRSGASAALLNADVARLTKWLQDAQQALKEAGVHVA
jgi:multidrug efflux pump subunit AcrA (membrane-fusion protein)